MDRGFMEHYFEIAYNDVTGEIAGEDEQYAELQQAADEAIQSLAGIVGEANTSIWKQCEHAINSLYAVQLHLAKLAYLRGAEDREKMLREFRRKSPAGGFFFWKGCDENGSNKTDCAPCEQGQDGRSMSG